MARGGNHRNNFFPSFFFFPYFRFRLVASKAARARIIRVLIRVRPRSISRAYCQEIRYLMNTNRYILSRKKREANLFSK